MLYVRTTKDFMKTIDYLRRQEAPDILQVIQLSSAGNDTDAISIDEIDAEITEYRLEKKGIQ